MPVLGVSGVEGARIGSAENTSENCRSCVDEKTVHEDCGESRVNEDKHVMLSKEVVSFVWDDGLALSNNFSNLGGALAKCGDLFRQGTYGEGLLLIPHDCTTPHKAITKANALAAAIIDRVDVVVKNMKGEKVGTRIRSADLQTAIASESFLSQFKPIDAVTTTPGFMLDFSVTKPGYNEGPAGQRTYYRGPEAEVSASRNTIDSFLDIMAFASEADRTNTVAFALTVVLRNHFPGGKPIAVITATKSHAGKGTVVNFASGSTPNVSISYQQTDWALERAFVGALKASPDTGVVIIDNARLDGKRYISSAFLERYLTDESPLLFSTGTGGPDRRANDLVLAITTNDGLLSTDLNNRSLPVRLEPRGDVESRDSAIGNPKYEYLPANRNQIDAELRGMIQRWKEAGRPLDHSVRHPFSVWAATVGGILKVSGFQGFLANFKRRKSADDVLRHALGILGTARPSPAEGDANSWYRAGDWARLAVELGLTKRLIPEGDRDSEKGRERGVGGVLTAHRDETFIADTEQQRLTLVLRRARRRFEGGDPSTRYRFEIVDKQELPADEDFSTGSPGPETVSI